MFEREQSVSSVIEILMSYISAMGVDTNWAVYSDLCSMAATRGEAGLPYLTSA